MGRAHLIFTILCDCFLYMLHYLDVAIWSRSVSFPDPSWLPKPRPWFDRLEVGLGLEVSLENLFFSSASILSLLYALFKSPNKGRIVSALRLTLYTFLMSVRMALLY